MAAAGVRNSSKFCAAKELHWVEVPVRSGRESQEWSSKKIPIFDVFEVVQFLWGTAGVEVPDDQLNAYLGTSRLFWCALGPES